MLQSSSVSGQKTTVITYTQKPQLETMTVMSHFLAVEKLRGHSGSLSPPSHPTSKPSLSFAGACVASVPSA